MLALLVVVLLPDTWAAPLPNPLRDPTAVDLLCSHLYRVEDPGTEMVVLEMREGEEDGHCRRYSTQSFHEGIEVRGYVQLPELQYVFRNLRRQVSWLRVQLPIFSVTMAV